METANLHASQVLRIITDACTRHDITLSRFGRASVKDPRLVFDIRNGRTPAPRTLGKIRAFIASLEERR